MSITLETRKFKTFEFINPENRNLLGRTSTGSVTDIQQLQQLRQVQLSTSTGSVTDIQQLRQLRQAQLPISASSVTDFGSFSFAAPVKEKITRSKPQVRQLAKVPGVC